MIVGRMRPSRPVVVVVEQTGSTRNALLKEWLSATLSPGERYSVPETVSEPTGDGGVVDVRRTQYFQLLAVAQGSSRPHDMPTHETADDPLHTSQIAVQVRFLTPKDGVEQSELQKVLHFDGDIAWISLARVAPFETLNTDLMRWRTSLPSVEHECCLVWSEPEKAKPNIPINDIRCPTLELVQSLQTDHHLVPVERTVIHTPTSALEFDAREATRMRFYYLVCLNLPYYLRLAGDRIPSQEPVHCYEALLRRVPVQAGLTDKEYLVAINDARRHHRKVPLPIPVLPPAPPLADGDDTVFAPLPPGIPEPEPKAKAAPSARRHVLGGGPGGSGGGEAGPPPAPPPQPPPVPLPGPGPVCPGPPVPPIVDLPDEAVAAPPPAPVAGQAQRRRGGRRDVRWMPALEGAEVRIDTTYEDVVSGRGYANITLRCPHHPPACFKTRGTGPGFCETYGDIESLAWLQLWARTPRDPTKRSHRLTSANVENMEEYVRTHEDALRTVLATARAA